MDAETGCSMAWCDALLLPVGKRISVYQDRLSAVGDQFSGYGIGKFFYLYAFLLAGIPAIVLGSMLERRFLKPEQGAAGKIPMVVVLRTVAQYMFFYIGLAHTSGVKASIIEAVNVIF